MTGRLWPFRTGMVKPARQPASPEGILIPDLMVAFEINVAGVIARRGYPMLSQPGAPAFLAWVGAPGEIEGPRQVARIWRACTR